MSERKITFNNIDWKKCNKQVANLQEKIVVAWKEGNHKKVKRLQEILINSFHARALAVKKVVSNDGGKTPGVDKITWSTEKSRTEAIFKLKNIKGYKPLPLLRKMIPKDNGKMRPLSIPTILDRAMQALHLMSLDPIAEQISDKNSFGFRKHRSCHDAIEACFILLSQKNKGRFILDADIKGFFDNISHKWILENVPMDKKIMKTWLKSGYLEDNIFHETDGGVPQGGIISPTIANIVLTGLEPVIKTSVQHLKRMWCPKVHVVRYADDFIVTAKNREIIEKLILPAIQTFLKERGLELNMEKTKIRNISEGFDFLGFTISKKPDKRRKTGEIYITIPSDKSIKKMKAKLKSIFLRYKKVSAYVLISELNPILRGWANYFKVGIAKRVFTKVNAYLFYKLMNWATKKHSGLGIRASRRLYFKKRGNRDWIFTGETLEKKPVEIFDITGVSIKRHVKVRDLNPYLSENYEYFEKRKKKAIYTNILFNPYILKVLDKTKGLCKVCNETIETQDEFEVHHILPKKQGGKDSIKNLLVLHKSCHHQVTYNKNPTLQARFQESGIIAPDSKGKI